MADKRKKLLELFWVFFKIGAFTFGGGFAMIPLMKRELCDNKGWISDEEMVDMIALAQTAPGVVAVNSATIMGYRVMGFWGAFVSTFAVILPSFITISVISLFFEAFKSIKLVSYAFWGIRSAVALLIFDAVLRLAKGKLRDIFNLCVIGLTFLAVTFFGVSAALALVLSIAAGIVISKIDERGGQNADGAD